MKKILFWGLAALALLLLVPAVWVFLSLRDLPDVSVLKHYRPAAASEVLDRNGNPLAHYYERKFRVWVPIASLPDSVIQAVVTAEDDTFFGHKGINYKAVWEALQHDMQKKRFSRGGSTITQQMIKNVLLSKEKTLTRKLREFVLAQKAEELLTKRQILEIYLNEVEWGEDVYGIEAASRYYFDKHASELTHAEAALLAGMLPNPKYYDPFKRPDKARKRQERVLFNMQQAKLLTPDEYQQALAEPLWLRDLSSKRFDLPSAGIENVRPCHLRALQQVLLSFFSEPELFRGGRRIRTTLDRSVMATFAGAEQTNAGGPMDVPESVAVVREGTEIRALACAADEERARTLLNALDPPLTSFEVLTVPLHSITREQLLAPEPRTAPTDSAGRLAPDRRSD
jgi:monofunctional biosynthetic peptidoglycan transglycosylase